MNKELAEYIEQMHKELYNLILNNCFHKHIRIYRKARALSVAAELFLCQTTIPRVRWFIPPILVHMYAKIEGKVVDVSLSPNQERELFPNSKYQYLLSVKVIETA